MDYQAALDEWYPAAEPVSEAAAVIRSRVTASGGDLATTAFATSFCSDELCRSLERQFADLIGPFNMGGLAGLPFTGRTGMTAFAHHVPAGGTALILYGAHVGVSRAGELGQTERPGLDHAGPCCGALCLALGRFQQAGAGYQPKVESVDLQQGLLENELTRSAETVLAAANPIFAATEAVHATIAARIAGQLTAVANEFHCARVISVGGILINTPPGEEDQFVLLDEQVRQI